MESFGQLGAMSAVMVAAVFVWQVIEDNLMGENW